MSNIGKENFLTVLSANALDSFSIDDKAVDIYIKEFLTKHEESLTCEDETFIIEVFSGCVYYNKLLKHLVDGFYRTDGKNILKSFYNTLVVISYLFIFRINEVGFKRLKSLALSFKTSVMTHFFAFLLSDDAIKGWIYDQWCEAYEKKFVDDKIIEVFDAERDQLQGIMNALQAKVQNDISPKFVRKPPVVPEPFDLATIKPRAILLPKEIPYVKETRPVPESNRKKPIYEKKLQKMRQKNRDEVLQRLEQANKNKFQCARTELSDATIRRLEKIKEEEEAKLNFNQNHYQEPLVVEDKPVKMNVTAILREGLLYQKKEKESEKYLAGLLRGDFDKSKFDEWQQKMLAEDKHNKIMNTKYQRLQGKISREQAILSRKQKEQENHEAAEAKKLDLIKKQEDQLVDQIIEEKRIKELIDEVNRSHQAAQEAKVKHTLENQEIVKQINKESRELMRRALEEEEERMKKRSEMIAQIRALEHLRPERKVMLDLTSTAGHRLFSEMSFAELQERLRALKEEQLHQQEKKNQQIKKAKQEKSRAIIDTIAKISMHREEICHSTVMKAKRREEDLKAQTQLIDSDEKLKQLQRKLEMKKNKRAEIKKAEAQKKEAYKNTNFRGLIRNNKDAAKTNNQNRWKHLENSNLAKKELKISEKC